MERLSQIGSHLAPGVGVSRAAGAYTPPTEPAVTTFKQVDGGDDLSLHIFSPFSPPAAGERGDPAACAVFFFGGGWVNGNPGQFFPHCAYLASRGMVHSQPIPCPPTSQSSHDAVSRAGALPRVSAGPDTDVRSQVAISAEYRTESSHGTDPYTCVADGRSAMRWVRAHAAELNVDPHRIAAGGGSAGGHVAAVRCITLSPSPSRSRSPCRWSDAGCCRLLRLRLRWTTLRTTQPSTRNPTRCCSSTVRPAQPPSAHPHPPLSCGGRVGAAVYSNGPDDDDWGEGFGYGKVADRYTEISPLHLIEDGVGGVPPPSLTMFGEGDALVPVPTMQRFQASFPHNEMRSFGRCFSATAFSLFEAFLDGLRFAGGVSRGRPAKGGADHLLRAGPRLLQRPDAGRRRQRVQPTPLKKGSPHSFS